MFRSALIRQPCFISAVALFFKLAVDAVSPRRRHGPQCNRYILRTVLSAGVCPRGSRAMLAHVAGGLRQPTAALGWGSPRRDGDTDAT